MQCMYYVNFLCHPVEMCILHFYTHLYVGLVQLCEWVYLVTLLIICTIGVPYKRYMYDMILDVNVTVWSRDRKTMKERICGIADQIIGDWTEWCCVNYTTEANIIHYVLQGYRRPYNLYCVGAQSLLLTAVNATCKLNSLYANTNWQMILFDRNHLLTCWPWKRIIMIDTCETGALYLFHNFH